MIDPCLDLEAILAPSSSSARLFLDVNDAADDPPPPSTEGDKDQIDKFFPLLVRSFFLFIPSDLAVEEGVTGREGDFPTWSESPRVAGEMGSELSRIDIPFRVAGVERFRLQAEDGGGEE